MSKHETIADLSTPEIEKRAAKAVALIDEIEALFPGLAALAEDDRRTSDGRLRTDEDKALAAVLDVAEAHPQAFAVLADKDHGTDPKTFETKLLRERLGRVVTLDKLATHLEDLARDVRDTQLTLGGDTRRVILAAYEIAKSLAKVDPKLRSKLSTAIDFYGAPAKKAAQTRAQRRTAPRPTG